MIINDLFESSYAGNTERAVARNMSPNTDQLEVEEGLGDYVGRKLQVKTTKGKPDPKNAPQWATALGQTPQGAWHWLEKDGPTVTPDSDRYFPLSGKTEFTGFVSEYEGQQGVAEGLLNEVTQGVEHSEWADNVRDAHPGVKIIKKRTEDGRHIKSQAILNGQLVGQYNMNTGVGTFKAPKQQGVAEGSDGAVSFREMIDVVDQHYPKYYAELSGSDISDKQFERAIVNAYKEIIKKQGVAEGTNDDFEQAHHNEVEKHIAAHGTPGEYSHKYDDMGNAHNSHLTYPGRTVTINTQQYGDRFGHNVFTKKEKEVDEGYDKWGWVGLVGGEL